MEQSDLLDEIKDMMNDKNKMGFRGSTAGEFLQCILSDVALNASNANTFYKNYKILREALIPRELPFPAWTEMKKPSIW